MKMKYEDWLDQVSVLFAESRPDAGEDGFYAAWRPSCAVAAVADGSGGMGARRYEAAGKHTGAYLASRIAAAAVGQWFAAYGDQWKSDIEAAQQLDGLIRRGFQICQRALGREAQDDAVGTLVRLLPSTLAMAALRHTGGRTRLCVIWAGDSRVYRLDANGLCQLTRDDAEGATLEAMESDAPMSNVLSADGNYQLNTASGTLDAPCLVLAATDGCFGYLQTPMEFEYYLLHAITQSETPEAFEASLRTLLGEIAGDDFTLAFTVTGMGDYATLRSRLRPRYEWMWKEMIEPLYRAYESGDAAQIAETKRRLWAAYRPAYQSQIAGKGSR